MSCASLALLIVAVAGCWLEGIRVPNAGSSLMGLALLVAGFLPVPLYLKEKGKPYLRESLLTIAWALLLYGLLHFPVVIAARVGAGVPLKDRSLGGFDRALGVDLPGIVSWTSGHWAGHWISASYVLLIPMMWAAVLVPIVSGRVGDAQRFLRATLIAFALGLPLFVLLPAVGPWYLFHFAAGPAQAACQATLLHARAPGMYVYDSAGFICFPSFHVVWAILCANALWSFRVLRIPAALVVVLILISTMTTGWHYFADVLGGITVATAAIALDRFVGKRAELAREQRAA